MAESNPTPKLCECGCGRPTTIAKQTDHKRGSIKGEPQRFIKGHNPAMADDYPRSTYARRGFGKTSVDIHRQRAEEALGHPLPLGAEIHHPDEDPWNRNARLVICPSAAYHKLLHARMRVKAAGGDPNTQKVCTTCRKPQPFGEFYSIGNGRGYAGRASTCRSCLKIVRDATKEERNAKRRVRKRLP